MPLIGSFPLATLADSPRNVPLSMPWWYRSDNVHLVGSKADVIKDMSGNGNDSLQTTDSSRFVWGAATGPNGTPGLTGAGSQFSTTAGNVDLSAATQLTILFVLTPNGLDVAGTDTLVNNRLAGTNQGFAMESASSGGQDVYEAEAFSPPISAPFSLTASINPAPANSPVIVEAQYDKTVATNQTNVWINGVLLAQIRLVNNQSTGTFQSLPVSIGRNFNIPTQCLKGTWAESFAYVGLLTAAQRLYVTRYLGTRYAITVP